MGSPNHQSTALKKPDHPIKRENNDLSPTKDPTQVTQNIPTMSQAQNGDVVTQTTQVSIKNLQVNGANGAVSSRKVTTLRDATQRAIAM